MCIPSSDCPVCGEDLGQSGGVGGVGAGDRLQGARRSPGTRAPRAGWGRSRCRRWRGRSAPRNAATRAAVATAPPGALTNSTWALPAAARAAKSAVLARAVGERVARPGAVGHGGAGGWGSPPRRRRVQIETITATTRISPASASDQPRAALGGRQGSRAPAAPCRAAGRSRDRAGRPRVDAASAGTRRAESISPGARARLDRRELAPAPGRPPPVGYARALAGRRPCRSEAGQQPRRRDRGRPHPLDRHRICKASHGHHEYPSDLNGRRVLVTGGSGFIGRHVVSELTADGAQVRVVDLQPHPDPAVDIVHRRHRRPDVLARGVRRRL